LRQLSEDIEGDLLCVGDAATSSEVFLELGFREGWRESLDKDSGGNRGFGHVVVDATRYVQPKFETGESVAGVVCSVDLHKR